MDCLFNRKVEDAALNSSQVNQLGLEGPHKVKLLGCECGLCYLQVQSISFSYNFLFY